MGGKQLVSQAHQFNESNAAQCPAGSYPNFDWTAQVLAALLQTEFGRPGDGKERSLSLRKGNTSNQKYVSTYAACIV